MRRPAECSPMWCSIMTALWFSHLDPQDKVAVKPHASPVLHAINYLIGALDGSYLTRRLAPAGVTPSACRKTRIAQLVNDLDPKLTAAALGMQDSGLVRYLADNVDHDRLQRTAPG